MIEKLAYEYMRFICENYPDRKGGTDLSEGHEGVRKWIKKELLSSGFPTEWIMEQKYESHYGNGINLILRIPGTDRSGQIIVGAHYDGDGCGDNASGTALLLSLAMLYRDSRPKLDTVITFWDQEEEGCLGSEYYVKQMPPVERDRTVAYINMDALMFGDYCCMYGGYTDPDSGEVLMTDLYRMTCRIAERHGIRVYGPENLDGFYRKNGTGPEPDRYGLYTNPWTRKNPAPVEHGGMYRAYSPSTIPMSDHRAFADAGIATLYFEATNWFVGGDDNSIAYMGYYETYDGSLGQNGMFMNTEYDTIGNLVRYFPQRAEEHFHVYAVLLEAIVMELPDVDENQL